MTNNSKQNSPIIPEKDLKSAQISQSKRISPFWLLPFIALCIGAFLFFQIVKEQGETIHITFLSGDGLVANKTQVRYQGLQIGVVKKVNFTDDLKKVAVEANIYPEAKTVLRHNTKFWLVKPSASLAGISGLDALVSGNYITLQPGDGDYRSDFVAETEGPIAEVKEGDLLIHLYADDLGSISAGAAVYYKKMPVGKIYDYRFTKDQKQVEIDIVIERNYASLVKKDSRFWNISGIKANMNLSGVSFNMDSLNALVQGAVTFDSPEDSEKATSDTKFKLYDSLQSAKRGILVDITLPNVSDLVVNETPVYFQEHKIGLLTALETEGITPNTEMITGKLLIDPNMSSLLKGNSTIILRDKKPSLSDLANLKDLLKGHSFEIIEGTGEPSTSFTVIKASELLLKQKNNVIFDLKAPETYGVKAGEPIFYNGMPIGEIVTQNMTTDGVTFKAVIKGDYRHLVYADNQFVAASNLDVSVNLEGVRMLAATPEKWLQGGVRMLIGKNQRSQPAHEYPLFSDMESAELGMTSNKLMPSITLTAANLPSIDKNSLVLYRQYEVGKVLDIRPKAKNFEVDVYLYPKHQSLLTNKSRFWVENAAQVDVSPAGIRIQTTPIMRALKGAISFDNHGSGNKILYMNELQAKSVGNQITLLASDASNISKGMPLRYLGLNIGEIDTIKLDQQNHRVVLTALISSNYINLLAREGSRFQVISPKISAGAIENLDTVLQPYINVDIGEGKAKRLFRLSQTVENTLNKYNTGFPLILEASDVLNLTEGSPVLYRGVEVGTIKKMDLNELGDRVLVHIILLPKFKHLVRQNSQFWIASGYSLGFGWSGASFNTGSVQQFLKGGIAFSTPSGKIVRPAAKPNQRFLLQVSLPKEAKEWNQGSMPVEAYNEEEDE